MLRPGARIDRYELVRMVGEGNVAQVWVARQEGKHGFEKHFALKAVHPHLAKDGRFRATFLEEARRAAAIEHPNVAQIFDLGEYDGLLYLVMEHVEGQPLDTLMATTGAAVPPHVALRIAGNVCAGLHAAHALGIVHGHVAPHVVMLSARGAVKLIDFGTTRAAGDASADVRGAGSMLYEMLAGRPPALSAGAPPPLPSTVPPPIAAVALRALSTNPDERYATAQDMAAAIEGVLAAAGHVPDVAAWVKTLDKGEPAAPGFMDVRALVAQRGGTAGTASNDDEEDVGPVEPKPFQPAEVGYRKAPSKKGISRVTLAVLAGLLVAVLGAAVLLAPGYVKDRAIARAREAGIDLQIARAAVGFSGISLHDVTARILTVPEVHALRIDDIEIVGLSGREFRVRGLDATIDGPFVAVSDKLLALANDNRRRVAGTAKDPHRYVLVSGRFTWTRPFGDGTKIDAGQVGLDLDSRGAGLEEIRASIARFDVKTSLSTLGPWGFAYERNAQSARARVLFDPPLMDGPSALVVWSQAGASQLTVRIPRSPMAQLGIRPAELGLPADAATEVEGAVEGEANASGAVSGKGRLDLWAARVNGIRGPVDIRVEGEAAGVSGKPLALDKTSVAVGPFIADVDGTIDPQARGLRVDATWRTRPIACEKVVRAEATKMGPIAEAIQDIAHRTGAARVTGMANASGLLRYDTATPGDVAVTWTTKDTCGLSLFGL